MSTQCNTVNARYFGKHFGVRRRAEQRSASAERCSALQLPLRLRRALAPLSPSSHLVLNKLFLAYVFSYDL